MSPGAIIHELPAPERQKPLPGNPLPSSSRPAPRSTHAHSPCACAGRWATARSSGFLMSTRSVFNERRPSQLFHGSFRATSDGWVDWSELGRRGRVHLARDSLACSKLVGLDGR